MTIDDVKKQGWSAEELGDQSSYEGSTDIGRRMRRGDETAGDPDARDVAGGVAEEETPYGSEVRDRPPVSHKEQPEDEQPRESDDA